MDQDQLYAAPTPTKTVWASASAPPVTSNPVQAASKKASKASNAGPTLSTTVWAYVSATPVTTNPVQPASKASNAAPIPSKLPLDHVNA